MRIGVVGSRDWDDEVAVRVLVASLRIVHGEEFTFVSGGAYNRTREWMQKHPGADQNGGVDYWAENQARVAGYKVDIMPAQWEVFGKIAGMIRNQDLIDSCDYIHIFWNGKSPGTRHLIRYATKQKKRFEVHH